MFKGVDHVVVAVKDLEEGIARFEKLFGIPATERGEPPGAGFRNAYFRFGGAGPGFVEVIAPTDETGPVGRRVAAGGEGVYLIALAVDDLARAVAELREKGVRLVGDPGPGNPITGQVFVHPSHANGVLVQLVQR
jgi:methylmalonyl-CoA/ethylmalonyl-CoA epimerase